MKTLKNLIEEILYEVRELKKLLHIIASSMEQPVSRDVVDIKELTERLYACKATHSQVHPESFEEQEL